MSITSRSIKTVMALLVLLSPLSSGFVIPSHSLTSCRSLDWNAASRGSLGKVYSSSEEGVSQDNEIERLKSLAAQLRAEAASLEAEKAQELADAAEKMFVKFDSNQDGEISLSELKQGLEKNLKMELSESRVKALMDAFDTSGDGALQLDEFVGVDKFRNKLEALARDEKALALEAKKQAQKEAEAALLAEARLAILNDKPATNTEKVLSVLPYLFPLMDGLQFGRFLLAGDANPLISILAILYTLYRSIPFGGFIAFLALNFLSGNPSINRLIRFNLQQAIFLDIALFFPSLIYSVYTLVLSGLGLQIPAQFTELGTDAVFVLLIGTISYAVVSSLLGYEPDKVPLISKAVTDRMPTMDMFDDKGRFIGRDRKDNDKDSGDKGEK